MPFLKKLFYFVTSLVTIILLLIIGGYIYTLFHGYINITLRDVSKKGIDQSVRNATILFHDNTGKIIGSGNTDEKYGAVYIHYPDFGPCDDNVPEKDKWVACSRERAKWSTHFAKKISSISVETAHCRIEKIPVDITIVRNEAFTYWMPIPDIIGTPHTYFFIHINIDLSTCVAVN